MARPRKIQVEEVSETKPKSSNPLILTKAEHAKLTPKEKEEFRAKNGTVSNQ